MKKKSVLFVLFLIFVLSGCLGTSTVGKPTESVITPSLTKESTPTPTEVFTPSPTLTATPEIPTERSLVTLEDVRNVKHSSEILINDEGVLIGLPEEIPEEEKALVASYYEAIQKKFLGSRVFYNKDEKTGKWLLFARYEKNLFHRTILVDGNTARFADYPLKFEPLASGSDYQISGSYSVIVVQNESIDVIWKEGIPQIVYDEVELLPGGDRYFTKYLIYDVDVTSSWLDQSNWWADVPGVYEVIAAAPTPVLTNLEEDLEPSYVQETNWEYQGVRIKANLVTDSSLNSGFTKVTVPNASYAEFIARTIFRVWWKKGPEKHTSIYNEEDFLYFMSLWSIAQKSGKVEDWEKIQLNNIWANDLTDGNGYVPKSYNIWPMYEGNRPLKAVGVSLISLVLVDTSSVKNIDLQSDITGISYDIGWGTNLDLSTNNLMIYFGTDTFITYKQRGHEGKYIVDPMLSCASDWLIENTGNGISKSFDYNDLTNWLINHGLQVY